MQQQGSVFILARDAAARDLAVTLRALRWSACAFDSPSGLLDGLRDQVADVLVMQGAWPDMAERIASFRRAVPAAAVVWLPRENVSSALRIAALEAGADVCVDAGMEAREWDALLRSRRRRRLRGGSSWCVDTQAGALTGPAGQLLPLTVAECAFFIQLLNAPGQRLRREAVLSAEAHGSPRGTRRVDVMVSRLRAKAQRLGVEFPVLAVRGWGYMLRPEGG